MSSNRPGAVLTQPAGAFWPGGAILSVTPWAMAVEAMAAVSMLILLGCIVAR
jgi:hypothetical protein